MENAEAPEMAGGGADQRIAVVVACSSAAGQVEQVALSLPVPATLNQAIEQSGLMQRFPALAGTELKFGVWGQLRGSDQLLREADRVEIYRPLLIDPKDARRERSQRTRAAKARV